MRFDLKKFYDEANGPKQLDFEVDMSAMDLPGFALSAPAKCSFSAVPTRFGMELELSVQADVSAECARCLAPVKENYSFARSWQLKESDLGSEEFELPCDDKGCLDLDELAFQELVFEVPMVLLCSADCQGLCPICGKKKAAGCSCQQAEDAAPVDARLSILKQLLN